jgi:hypothetical protein
MNNLTILHYIVPMLHSRRLGPATLGERTSEVPVFPVHGTLYGYNKRPFFTLTCRLSSGPKYSIPPLSHRPHGFSCSSARWPSG